MFAILQAYVAGVNAYIQSLDYKHLPAAYKLLDYYPERWTPLKVILMMVKMTDDLCGNSTSVEHTNAFHQLGKAKFDFLFPRDEDNPEPVIPKNRRWSFKPLHVQTLLHAYLSADESTKGVPYASQW